MVTICEELRKSVLQAAIQGRLTRQLPEDGDAEELYQQIQEEKQRLIKEGKIKKEKVLPEITEDEIPFDIPENWKWVHVNDIFNVKSAMRIHQTDWRKEGIPFFRGRELVELSKTGSVNPEIFIDFPFYEELKKKGGVPQKDDILVSAVGTIGKTYIVKGISPFYYKDAYILCLENYGKINPRYVKNVIDSPYCQGFIKEGSMAVTVAQLTIIKLKSMIIPLPPLAEQERIVEKVDMLMSRIDEMEKVEKKLVSLHEEFPGNMRASLLQAAIQGRLTEQLESDGDAEDLYQQIQEEKQRLIKEGKIKKEKILSEITEDEIPFDIPENWKWCRLEEICNIIMGSSPESQSLSSNSSNMEFHQGKTLFTRKVIDHSNIYTSKPTKIACPQSVIMSVRAPVGDVNITDRFLCIGRGLASIYPIDKIDLEYIFWFLSTKKTDLEKESTGSTFKAISKNNVINILIPLPPLAEQKRIVEKLDQLLPLCDALESELK